MITLYGIPNCNSVKKARTWLENNNVPYHFHNFKKDGLTETTIRQWLKNTSLALLINKKGTTWKALSADEQHMANTEDSAITLMLQKTSVIKRPVIVSHVNGTDHLIVGYDETALTTLITHNNEI